jgi:hypothetical protein
MRNSPAAFRRELKISPNSGERFGRLLEGWQQKDFTALDPAWKTLAGLSSPQGVRRAYIERPRGHSKTYDMAVQLAWILLCARQRVHGLAAAADREQAGLIQESIERLAQLNPELCSDLAFRQHSVLKRCRTL